LLKGHTHTLTHTHTDTRRQTETHARTLTYTLYAIVGDEEQKAVGACPPLPAAYHPPHPYAAAGALPHLSAGGRPHHPGGAALVIYEIKRAVCYNV